MTEQNEQDILKNVITEAMLERKAHDLKVLDLRDLTQSVADYFIICHGTSTTQVDAICDFVERQTRTELQERPISKEGNASSQWVLLDYGNIVIHVFLEEMRSFYNLEDLWADAKIEVINVD